MIVFGIDLSGPRNISQTCVVVFEERGHELHFVEAEEGASDAQIVKRVTTPDGRVAAGIDAPLSYNPGGGDRGSDRQLRRLVSERGGGAAVMTPTMMRMVYLTLRGVTLTRTLASLGRQIEIVEVHPGAAMLLRGAPAENVRNFKAEPAARRPLCEWMRLRGLQGIPYAQTCTDHFVAACAAALSAWEWANGRAVWKYAAQPPDHPYDFAC